MGFYQYLLGRGKVQTSSLTAWRKMAAPTSLQTASLTKLAMLTNPLSDVTVLYLLALLLGEGDLKRKVRLLFTKDLLQGPDYEFKRLGNAKN